MNGIDKSAVRKYFLSHYKSAPQKLREDIAAPFDQARLHSAFVLIHSVRGDALAVGLRPIADLAHALEKSLLEAKDQTEPPGVLIETLWSDACTLLERQLQQAEQNEAIESDEALLSAFRARASNA